jgi:dCTP deaminase
MAILTSHEIRSRIKSRQIQVAPFDDAKVRQNSLDVTLGKGVCVYKDQVYVPASQRLLVQPTSYERSREFTAYDGGHLDVKKNNPVFNFTMDESGWMLVPGILYLMHIEEVLCTPKLVMSLDGRSSYARLGIVVHLTAGFAETGFKGQYTLEVTAMHRVRIYPGICIAQVIFHTVEGTVEDYQSRGTYTGEAAMGPQPSRSWKQFV